MIRVRKVGPGKFVQVMPDGSTVPHMGLQSDWERVRNMTEDEVIANALSDPDNPPLADEDFEEMELVPNVYIIRNRLGLTQLEFAETYGIALELIQRWEQGPSFPDSAARSFLRVIEQDPEGTRATLAKALRRAS